MCSAAAGSSHPGRWWSVTITPIPAVSAPSTAVAEELPQSAVTISPQPASRAFSTCTGWKP